jgi:hypothetical protein
VTSPWKKRLKWFALALVTIEVIASVATLPPASQRPDGPLLEGAQVPPKVLAILDRSCRDCHSDATRYPWYSYLAPVSTLVSRDVTRGRGFLNLSKWTEYSVIRRQRALTGIANQVKDGLMPLDIYIRLHPEARLSNEEVDLVFDWVQTERMRLIMEQQQQR